MGRTNAYRQLLLQVVISLLFAGVALFSDSLRDAYSALLGGLVVIIPTYVFIICIFHYSGARALGKMMGSFVLGEALKLLVMAILIVVVFKCVPVQPMVFLLSFLGVQFIATVMGFWQINKKAVNS